LLAQKFKVQPADDHHSGELKHCTLNPSVNDDDDDAVIFLFQMKWASPLTWSIVFVQDLTKLQASLDTIDGPSDQRTFVDHLKQPELTHCQSAALSLLHDPNNRGALVGVGAGSKSLEPNRQHDNHSSTLRSAAVASTELKGMEQVSPPSLTSESVPEMGLDASLSTDRLRTDMERIVIALFTTTTETSREISSQSTPETSSSTRHDSSSSSGGRASLGLATVAASLGSQLNITGSASTAAPGSIPGDSDSQHPLNPLHPLSPSSSDSSGATQAPPLAPNGPQTSPLSLTTTQQQQPKAASLITANERRRLIAMLDSDAGRQALVFYRSMMLFRFMHAEHLRVCNNCVHLQRKGLDIDNAKYIAHFSCDYILCSSFAYLQCVFWFCFPDLHQDTCAEPAAEPADRNQC
jgi:hypothetical protein